MEMHNSQCHDHFQLPSFECIAEKRINRILATINNLRSILIIVIVVASMQSIRCEHSAIIRSFRFLAHSVQSIKLRSTYQKSHLLLQSKEREKTNNIKTTTKATGERERAQKITENCSLKFGFYFRIAYFVLFVNFAAKFVCVVSIKCITGHSRHCWKNGNE